MNAITPIYNIQDLVPHRTPVLLVDALVECNNDCVKVRVRPRDSALFLDADGKVPSWVGIEYMAQAIATYAGVSANLKGDPIKLGFLLGTRRYSAKVSHFNADDDLQVSVKQLLRDENNLVLFACTITVNGEEVATAEIKDIQPNNLDELLRQFDQLTGA